MQKELEDVPAYQLGECPGEKDGDIYNICCINNGYLCLKLLEKFVNAILITKQTTDLILTDKISFDSQQTVFLI